MWSNFLTFIVGTIFLFTGGIKAISSRQFIDQVYDYGILPPRWMRQVAIGFIGLESVLGIALMLRLFPSGVIPGTIMLLVFLSGLTLWGALSRRIEDCGCYGGILLLTPRQSLLLNISYILLLSVAWGIAESGLTESPATLTWKLGLVSLALIVGVTLGWRSQREPLIDIGHLKVGKRWKERWLKESPQTRFPDGCYFVVFLSQSCPYCELWVPLLNVMNAQTEMPNVIGIMSLKKPETEALIEQHLVNFPIAIMDRGLVRLMVQAFPTAARIEDGIITNIWRGEIPQPYFDKIQQFYESISPNRGTQKRLFTG